MLKRRSMFRRVLIAAIVATGIGTGVWAATRDRPVKPALAVAADHVTVGPFSGGPSVRVVCVDSCRGDVLINARAASATAVELMIRSEGGRLVVTVVLPGGALSVPVRPDARFVEAYLGEDNDGAKCVLVVLRADND